MELERLIAVLGNRWRLLGAVALACALVGQIAEMTRTDQYTATATVEVAPDRDVYGSETVLNRLVINEMGMIGTSVLRTSLVDSLGDVGAAIDPAKDLNIQQIPDTDLVNIHVSATDQDTAIAAANIWARAYVELDRARERAPLQAQLDEVNAELLAARQERLALDEDLAELVVDRRSGAVPTYLETVLRDPELWDAIVKLDQDIEILVAERAAGELALSNVLDTSVAAQAIGPIKPVRSGNGLGAIEGLIIGFFIAVGVVVATSGGRASQRAVVAMTNTLVWPTSIRLIRGKFALPWQRRSIARSVASLSTQVLNRLPDTRLQVVAFAGIDRKRTHELKDALADDLAVRGYSVSMLGDADSSSTGTLDGFLDVLNAENSVVFADHDELRSKRFTGRVVTVVSVDEHRDREDLVARQIADSVSLSDSVLTVVAR